ncbi:unnamed protein product [Rhizophagus irregularis]|nr:unnamed protein product [Rhizophagus irregularis]
MWELMTGRRPLWDRDHDIELIHEICDGLRPPIVTNAPEESDNYHESNPTKIIKSSDIGPVTINNPSGIYESNSLSLIMSTESTRSLTEIDSYQSDEGSFNEDKRRLDNNLIEDEDTKKIRLSENDDDGIA